MNSDFESNLDESTSICFSFNLIETSNLDSFSFIFYTEVPLETTFSVRIVYDFGNSTFLHMQIMFIIDFFVLLLSFLKRNVHEFS